MFVLMAHIAREGATTSISQTSAAASAGVQSCVASRFLYTDSHLVAASVPTFKSMYVFNEAAISPMRPPGIMPLLRALDFQLAKRALDLASFGSSFTAAAAPRACGGMASS